MITADPAGADMELASPEEASRKCPVKHVLVSLAAFASWCIILWVATTPSTERGFGFSAALYEGFMFQIFLGLLISLQGLGKMVDPLGYFEAVKAFKISRLP